MSGESIFELPIKREAPKREAEGEALMARKALDIEDAACEIVERTCAEQGLEVEITDPVTIGKVATILRGQDPTLRRDGTAADSSAAKEGS